MESLEALAEGNTGVFRVGAVEYFVEFFDYVDDGSHARTSWRTRSSLTAGEVDTLAQVLDLVDAASSATPQKLSTEDLVATGWPSRVQPYAAATPRMMRERGRYDEEAEEAEPSGLA
jgi:hypothetical protein